MKVVAEFLNETIIYLDSLNWIERYAWFGYFVSSIAELDLFRRVLTDSLASPTIQRPRPDVHYSKLLPKQNVTIPQFILNQDLLQDDGGLNQLGEMYTGAKTIHTGAITSSPTSAYQTFNGADSTAPATTWATLAASGSALQLGAIGSGWFKLLISTIIPLGCSIGALWTVSWAP